MVYKKNTYQNTRKIITLLFIKNLTPKINRILTAHNFILINKLVNKSNYLIKLGKDKLEITETNNIIYKINCEDCPATYIGMSKRKLKKRIYEHQRSVKLKNEKSALSIHVQETEHKINFEKVKILDKERNFYKRSLAEMLCIYSHNHTLNSIEDIQFLKNSYKKNGKIDKLSLS